MSKLTTRIALSILISLIVIAGIYTTVFGAAANTSNTRAGSHLVSGAKVNLDHYREADPAPASLQPVYRGGQSGGCNHSNQAGSED
jgi:hypothetical protein